MTGVESEQAFWDRFARYDPLWAILSDPSKTDRRWDLPGFLETGRREISLLMYQLRALGILVPRASALDFGCGVGRLSQPLAGYFDRVVGVDISSEMIGLANQINGIPGRVRYVCNARDDLAVFADAEFTFLYSNVVLQHIPPERALQYLNEFFRVVAPGGVLVFQLPSHLRPAGEQQPGSRAMADHAYRASIRIDGEVPRVAAAASQVMLTTEVTNASGLVWSQRDNGPIRLGNHWLAEASGAMLIQDDGRAPLPEVVEPGRTCRVIVTATAPPEPGEYQIECDLVHEGITWFADRGSPTWRSPVRVPGVPGSQLTADEAGRPQPPALTLPDPSTVVSPGPLPMYGIDRDVVASVANENHGTIVHVEADERCGPEWLGYRYFIKKEARG